MSARFIKSIYDALLANAGIVAAVPLYNSPTSGSIPNIHSGEAPADCPYPYITVGPIVSDVRSPQFATKDTKARLTIVDITILGRSEQDADVEQIAIIVRDLFDSTSLVITGAENSPLVNSDGPIEKPTGKEYQGYVVTVRAEYET